MDHLNLIEQSCEGLPGPLPPVVVPTSLTMDNAYGDTNEFSIYQWDVRAPLHKAHWLDFGDLVIAKELEDNSGIDTNIVPMFWGDMLIRDHLDINSVWVETVRLLRPNVFDRDLQIPDIAFRIANASPNLSHF